MELVKVASPVEGARNNSNGPSPVPLIGRQLMSRQPIFNGNREAIGYELLFKADWKSCFLPGSGAVVGHPLNESFPMGIAALTGNLPAFIKCAHEDIVTKMVTLLPPKATVLEIVPSLGPCDELLDACRELRAMGYAFALGPFLPDHFLPNSTMAPLLEIASYVKVNFRDSSPEVMRETKRIARATKAVLLGEMVEDHLGFAMARTEGLELFQGNFFRRPKMVANRPITPSRMAYLRLMMELARSPVNLNEVMRIVQSEPTLCYRLLVMANSPLWGVRSEVTSPRHALMLMGENRFRTLVSVATSCMINQAQPPALISLSLQRARFCELLAPHAGETTSEQFILGLLSLLDAMLESPMESLLKPLPLRAEAKAALMGAADPVGVPLGLIQNIESRDWESCIATAGALRISEETLAGAYVESVEWAREALAAS
jgi:c-di-GMP-related signal transduction protein